MTEIPRLEGRTGAQKRGWRISILGVICFGALIGWALVTTLVAYAQGRLTGCRANFKNIPTAMEMYRIDWGVYPPRGKSQLTPNYLKTIPECPAAGTDTYLITLGPDAPYNTESYEDYYFMECHGENHALFSIPGNYPQYNSVVGFRTCPSNI